MAKRKAETRGIKVEIKTDNVDKVKIKFIGAMFTPEEFTSIFMGIVEAYSISLIEKNGKVPVFEHWNRVFGTFLKRILPEDMVYQTSEAHKKAKEAIDASLGKEDDITTARNNETNRVAAMILAKDILLEAGLEEKSVDVLINKKIGLITPTKPN
jgi:hypothetical protein